MLSYISSVSLNDRGAGRLIVLHDRPVLLGVQLCRQSGRAHQVTEHHRQLATLGGIYRENTPRCGFLCATGSLLPVLSGCTAGRASRGTQTISAFLNSTSCCGFSIV